MIKITKEMPKKLVGYLTPGAPGLLLTAGADDYPSSQYTWVVGLDDKRLRLGADQGSTAQANLTRSGQAGLVVMGPDNVTYLVKGKVRQLKERIDAAAPAAIALYELEVSGVKDQSWPGVTIPPLHYEWTADHREELLRMEQAVFDEMREHAG
ncbi:MAG TPA: pyridoxamine 5'-phosphate oxidase family protein [Gammaproteobacteria bacterium]